MAQRVVLHIGTMKSGTTYLQNGLVSGADQLRDAGAYYVGGTFGVQAGAVGGMIRPPARARPEKWQRLVAELRGRDEVAVFSHEFLSFARPQSIAALVNTLEGLEVDVVITVRDQRRAIPAQWQTYARNLGTSPWAEFLRELQPMLRGVDTSSLALRKFRRAQDVPVIARRWADQPGVSSVTLVPVPGSSGDPTELWRRFCRASRLDIPVPPGAQLPVNESLGYASCHLLTWINGAITRLPKPVYRRARTRVVRALLPLRGDEGRPELDQAGAALADALNQRILAACRDRGVTAVDSLDELTEESAEDRPQGCRPPTRSRCAAPSSVSGGRVFPPVPTFPQTTGVPLPRSATTSWPGHARTPGRPPSVTVSRLTPSFHEQE